VEFSSTMFTYLVKSPQRGLVRNIISGEQISVINLVLNYVAVDWAPASLFIAELCQTLGPFLEWSVAGSTFVMRWRDRLLLEVANERYMSNKDMERKARQNLVNYFEVSFSTFTSSAILIKDVCIVYI